MITRKRKTEDFVPITFLVMMIIALFGEVIFSGKTLYGSDFLFYFYPIKRFAYDYLCTDGSLPFWNPHLFSGTPFIANIQASMFYPLGFLYYLVPTELAYLYSTILHCVLGSIFMYMFMRSLPVSKPGAFFSGFIFIFNGYFMGHLYAGHLSFVQSYIWIPLIFFFLIRFTRSGSFKYAVTAGLILGVQILGGFPQIAFYTILSVFLFSLYSCLVRLKTDGLQYLFKITVATSVVILIGFSLAAVQVLPTYEFSKLSTRAGGISYEFATMDSLPLRNLVTFLVPLLFGSPADGTFWITDRVWEFWEYCGYAGIVPLVIIFISIRRLSRGTGLFFILLALIALFLALGRNTPLYTLIYHLPGFKDFRVPAQILFLYVFSIAVLAGKGLNFLGDVKAFSQRYQQITFFILLFFLPLIIWVCGASDSFSYFLSKHIQLTVTGKHVSEVAATVGHAILRSYCILVAVAVMLYLFNKRSIFSSGLSRILIFIAIVDIGSFSFPLVQTVDISALVNKGKSLHYITQNSRLSRTTINGRCFIENAGLWYGFQDIQGYDPLILKRYMEYVNRSQGLAPDEKVVNLHYIDHVNNHLIQMLNLKYVVDCKEHRISETVQFIPRCHIVHKMVIKDKQEILNFMMEDQFDSLRVVVFEKGNAPAAFFPEEPIPASHEKCWITAYSNDEIRLVADMKAPGFLIMSEINYPGWQVFVDGTKKSILTGNYLFRVVPLNAGRHDIRFVFSPVSFKIGAAISVISLIGVIAFFFLIRQKWLLQREGRK